jgi:DNA-binding SARP family transcriptional activator
MDVQVLGPVGVHDGHDLAIGGGQHRRIVAAMAMRSGEVVSVDWLVDVMWPGDEMPQQPERNLRTYVSRIRAALGETNADRLETVAPGYVLHLGAHELDAQRFDDACATAGRCFQRDDFDGALERAAEAMRLWRGRPYAEFADEGWARSEVARLEEVRVAAFEVRCGALLELGRSGEAVPELEALISEHPLREHPRALHMKALATGGRQADALRAFRSFRQLLIDEVGIDPSDEVVELDRRIARGDALSAPTTQIRDYERYERIGSGAFADVYRGTQTSLGRDVAIKAVRAELANRPEFIRGFEAEAAMVARLEHPHIVPLYDFWREPDRAYLVMRWLTGGSVEARLDDGPWPMGQTAKMVEQIGSALALAHRAGVVHRDVKTANILLDDDENTYLTDFGIAVDATTTVNPVAALSEGSPAYAAPEQLRRAAVGPAADQFGLGIAAYEALVGSLPFVDATDRADLLRRQLHDALPSVRERRPEVPAAVDDVLAKATAKDPGARFDGVDEFVVAFTTALAESPAAPKEVHDLARRVTQFPRVVDNPYQGLHVFEEGDAINFYGRERLVDELLDSLRGDDKRFVAVVGPSGSGKSSAVAAGLVPALRSGRLDGSDRWFITTMTPGDRPYEALEAALLRIAVNPPASLYEQLRADRRGILRCVRRIVPGDDETVLVVIDQFEEMFTLVRDESVRERFLDALVVAATEAHSTMRIVLTLRADFYDQPLRYRGFAELLKRRGVTGTPLMADEQERAIVGPASTAGVEFEPGLVATVVSDVTSGTGSLPLMQFALTQLFDARVSGMMLLSTYRELGGLSGALALNAEQRFEQLDEAEQSAARGLFGRLVSLGEGVDDTARMVRRPEVGQDPSLDAVIECFGNARMLTFDRDPVSRQPTLALAHESLIGSWPRLQRWLEEDRERLTVLRGITEASERWRDGGHDDADLLVGGRLEAALVARDGPSSRLDGEELAFVERSEAVAVTAEQRGRRRARTLRLALVATSVFLVVAIISGLIATRQSRRAEERADAAAAAGVQAEDDRNAAEQASRDAERATGDAERAAEDAVNERETADQAVTALEMELLRTRAVDLAASDPALGALLAVEAYERDPVPASMSAIAESLLAVPGWRASLPASWVGALPSQSAIVTLEDEEFVIYGEGDFTPTARFAAPSGVGVPPSVAPDEQAVAMIAGDELVVTNLEDGSSGLPAPIPGALPTGLLSIAWSADGDHILVPATSPARVAVFAVEGNDVRHEFDAPLPASVAPETDILLNHHETDPWLAVGSLNTVAIFSTAELEMGRLPQMFADYDMALYTTEGSATVVVPNWGSGETLYVGIGEPGFVEIERGVAEWQPTPDVGELIVIEELADGSLFMSEVSGGSVHDPETLEPRTDPWPSPGALFILPAEIGNDIALVHYPLDSSPRRVTVWSRDATNPLAKRVPMPPTGAGKPDNTYIVEEVMVAGGIIGSQGPPIRLDLDELVDYGVDNVDEAEPHPSVDGWAAVVVTDDLFVSVHNLATGALWSGPFVVDKKPLSVLLTFDARHVVLWDKQGISARDADTGLEVARIDHGGDETLWVWLPEGPGPGILTDISGTSIIFDSETFERLATDVDIGTQAVFDSTGTRFAGRRAGSLVVGRWSTGTVEVNDEFEIPNQGNAPPAFDSSGDYIFGFGGTGVQAWDASDGAPIMPFVSGWAAAPWGAELNWQVRDGAYRLWNTDPTTWAARACEVVGRSLTPAEWEQHMPAGEAYRATCPQYS